MEPQEWGFTREDEPGARADLGPGCTDMAQDTSPQHTAGSWADLVMVSSGVEIFGQMQGDKSGLDQLGGPGQRFPARLVNT